MLTYRHTNKHKDKLTETSLSMWSPRMKLIQQKFNQNIINFASNQAWFGVVCSAPRQKTHHSAQTEWCILSRCSAHLTSVSCHPVGFWWILHMHPRSAPPPFMRYDWFALSWEILFIPPQLRRQQPWTYSVDYHKQSVMEQRMYCTTHMTSVTSWCVWLKSGRRLIRSLTGQSSSGVHMHSRTRRTLWTSVVAWTCFAWLTANYHYGSLKTLHFERCILNIHKTGNVLYISIKITPSCWFALLSICLKFQTNLTRYWCMHYSNFFRDLVFIWTMCTDGIAYQLVKIKMNHRLKQDVYTNI